MDTFLRPKKTSRWRPVASTFLCGTVLTAINRWVDSYTDGFSTAMGNKMVADFSARHWLQPSPPPPPLPKENCRGRGLGRGPVAERLSI